MTRFALIDLNSGFVWHVCDADTPEAACTIADAECGGDAGVRYTSAARQDAYAHGGLAVHVAPAGYHCADGEDADQIAEVVAMPLAGYYRALGEHEEA